MCVCVWFEDVGRYFELQHLNEESCGSALQPQNISPSSLYPSDDLESLIQRSVIFLCVWL